MKQPLVSIIIPVYNGSNYVREAIDSALAQTYPNTEVIVVNDGSTDGGETDRIVREYGDRVRYYAKKNGGVSSALNMGIRQMEGEYFSWLSHDDAYEPDKIEKQVALLAQCDSPESTLIYCRCMYMDADSQPIKDQRMSLHYTPHQLYSANEVLHTLLRKTTFNGCCLLIPKKALIECGGFDETLRFCQDAFMWYSIFMKDYSLLCTDEVCVRNRIHGGQLTQKGQALFRKECSAISEILASEFEKISTPENNFLKAYLISDARHFSFGRVKAIIMLGKKKRLISGMTACKAYAVCAYGKIRPFIRKLYYTLFRRIKTN